MMERDTFSQIRLWCPRPFGTYSQNKLCSVAAGDLLKGGGRGGGRDDDAAGCTPMEAVMREGAEEVVVSQNTPPILDPPPVPPDNQVEDGRVLLDTWYVIKPGNTKEKIAFFVAHQCSGAALLRPNTMKVKGRWGSDCTKAKRRRRCSYTPPGPAPDDARGLSETDLLSVAQMVALVERRTAMALQGIVAQGPPPPSTQTALPDPGTLAFPPEPPGPPSRPPSPSPCEVEEQETWRVAEAVAHFEAQQRLEDGLLQQGGEGAARGEQLADAGGASGEVRIAFRVSSMDPRSQAEPTGRPNCMFLSRGGGGAPSGARAKEKITCDLYQLLSPSSRDPSTLLGASPKPEHGGEAPPASPAAAPSSDPDQDHGVGERVTGFHVEVVVTGAVDQCVFYGKNGSEKVQEETVCFSVSGSPADTCEDPPPGQLFFLQPPCPEEERHGPTEHAGGGAPPGGAGERAAPPSPAPGQEQDRPDAPLCRLYRHVSHDFLEIRFQIQRLLEPRQYLLLLPDHIMVTIFSYLPTRSLAALKCTCHDFKALIETYGVRATDSRWNQDPLYRDDPCKQCKRQYARGDVSLCRWHPKPYHHDLPYGRSYWMCCRRTDKDTPGCRVGLHDNNWVQPCDLVQTRCKREDGR